VELSTLHSADSPAVAAMDQALLLLKERASWHAARKEEINHQLEKLAKDGLPELLCDSQSESKGEVSLAALQLTELKGLNSGQGPGV
jgi:hypothetical protein